LLQSSLLQSVAEAKAGDSADEEASGAEEYTQPSAEGFAEEPRPTQVCRCRNTITLSPAEGEKAKNRPSIDFGRAYYRCQY
jgi:hypothetical protein